MEAAALHIDMILLFIILLLLACAILVLGRDLLVRSDGQAVAGTTNKEFEEILEEVEVEALPSPPPPKAPSTSNKPTEFVFRRNLSHELKSPTLDEGEGDADLPPEPPPAKIAFSTIQSEIRAALGEVAQTNQPPPVPDSAALSWTETGKIAVLSLGKSPPAIAWSLLQAQGVHILIVPEDHPFPAPNRNIELLCLAGYDEASITALSAGLRAKMAKGERVAFYTETGLTGAASLLAARLSGRNNA